MQMADLHQQDVNETQKKNQILVDELRDKNIKLPEAVKTDIKLNVVPSQQFLHVYQNCEQLPYVQEFRTLPTRQEILQAFNNHKIIIIKNYAQLVGFTKSYMSTQH